MAEIRPFRGVRYNHQKVGNLADVICPPYDIIPPEMQQELCARSEYNFVRIEDSPALPRDTTADNRYTRSAAVLAEWLSEGVLRVDASPAIYLHDHYFHHDGREYRRRGMTVVVRLEEWSKMVVRPHEGTLSRPKGDRLNLIWALQANTSPILALFTDSQSRIAHVLEAESKREPSLRINEDVMTHHLWTITGEEAIGEISGALAAQPLYIADGHHRYESALTYCHERIACAPEATGNEPFNFVMMNLVDFDDPGLVILPAHRLIGGLAPSLLEGLRSRLETFFEIKALPLDRSDIGGQMAGLLREQREGLDLIACGLEAGSLLQLRLRDMAAAGQMMPYFHSDIYKSLTVSVLDHVILEKILGVGTDEHSLNISYLSDHVTTVEKVLSGEYQIAFLLNAVKARVIKDIADAGDRMPRKSTYFYPKVPSGLVFYYHGKE